MLLARFLRNTLLWLESEGSIAFACHFVYTYPRFKTTASTKYTFAISSQWSWPLVSSNPPALQWTGAMIVTPPLPLPPLAGVHRCFARPSATQKARESVQATHVVLIVRRAKEAKKHCFSQALHLEDSTLACGLQASAPVLPGAPEVAAMAAAAAAEAAPEAPRCGRFHSTRGSWRKVSRTDMSAGRWARSTDRVASATVRKTPS